MNTMKQRADIFIKLISPVLACASNDYVVQKKETEVRIEISDFDCIDIAYYDEIERCFLVFEEGYLDFEFEFDSNQNDDYRFFRQLEYAGFKVTILMKRSEAEGNE